MRAYESQLYHRADSHFGFPAVRNVCAGQTLSPPGLYNVAFRGVMFPNPKSTAIPTPPTISFQQMFAQMTAQNSKAHDAITLPVEHKLLDGDQRTSSIVALRKKAREHEVRIGVEGPSNSP